MSRKRRVALALAVVLVVSVACAFPTWAAEDDGGVRIPVLDDIFDGLETIQELLQNIADSIFHPDRAFENMLNQVFGWLGTEGLEQTLEDGGMMFVTDRLNQTMNALYGVFYPLGTAVLLVAWIVSTVRTGIFLGVDLQEKNSLARIVLDLVIGLFALGLAPQVMNLLTQLSLTVCGQIVGGLRLTVSGNPTLSGGLGELAGYSVIAFIVQCILLLNLLRMALLQCVSPVFVGLAAGGKGGTPFLSRMVREYVKCCLVPPVTAAYVYLCAAAFSTVSNFVFALAVGISIFSIANKMLDKLVG